MHASSEGDAWVAPPMHPDVPMVAGLDRLRPDVAPWLPPPAPSAPEARPSEIVALADGDTLDLVAAPVRRTIKGHDVTLYAFNGQIPGPMIRVPRGAAIVVRFANRLAMPASVTWCTERGEYGLPSSMKLPLSGGYKPVMTLKKVVLPAPLGPIRP